MNKEGGPSAEEMGLKPEETRILGDAELIRGGARIKEKGRLEVTGEQVSGARAEMGKEKAREAYEALGPEKHREFQEKDREARHDLARDLARLKKYLEVGTAGVEGIPKFKIKEVAGYAKQSYDRLVSVHEELQGYSYPASEITFGYDYESGYNNDSVDSLKDKYAELMAQVARATEEHWTGGLRTGLPGR